MAAFQLLISAKKRWCSQCLKDEKIMTKQKLAEENRLRELELEKGQQELFAQAMKKTVGENSTQTDSKPQPSPPVVDKQALARYYEKIEQEIQQAAMEQASEFVASQGCKIKCTQEQAMQVYSLLLLPEEILGDYM